MGLLTCSFSSPLFAVPLVADNFESGTGQWSAGGLWGVTPAASSSPVNSATDSPGAFYANNTDASLTLAAGISLSGIARPVLGFQHRYSLEPGYDYVRIEVSTNGGTSWSAPLASWSGEKTGFGGEQVELSAFGSSTAFKVRFRLQTDGSVVRDGWYVDDVRIGSAPPAASLNAAAAIARNSLALTWSAAAAGDFASYEIYRSLTPGVDWRTAWKVATLTDRAAATFTDTTLAPKTAYYYRVAVVNPDGFRSFSNEVTATTLAGMDFPVLDNGEAGAAMSTADAPWALSNEIAASGTKAWSDSPGGDYQPGITSQSLTLAAPVNLAATTDPVLCFQHRHALGGGDYGYVEVSTNSGADWTNLATFGGSSPDNAWLRGRVSLAAYKQSAVLVRFRLTSDPGAVSDGWHVDDISISESPPAVAAPAVDQITSNGARLSWQQSPDPLVVSYAVMRSDTAGAGINSTLAAMVEGRANTSFTDSGLLLDTNYYYRVYALNSYGGISADSPAEAQVHTLNNPPPFTDGFEGGTQGWIFNGTWAVTSEVAAGGSKCLTDSPGASYLNSRDTWAETSIDLRGADWPVLSFKDRYSLSGGDWLRVEIYDANQTWYWLAPYGVYESVPRTEWREQRIDLSPFKGRGNVRVRFRLATDGGTPGDGWFIDDLALTENPLKDTPQPLPMLESFESGPGNWIPAGWILSDAVTAKEGTKYAWDTEQDRFSPDTNAALTLARPLVLPEGSNMQVTYSVNGRVTPGSALRLQYSADGGVNWPELSTANIDAGFDSGTEWRRYQGSLQSLAGRTVRLRLISSSDNGARSQDVRVDKLTIAEMPAAVTLTSAVPALRSVALTWTPSSLGAAFQRYELWRSTSANVSVFNGMKVFESASTGATTFTDTGLAIGTTYFYRVFAVDTRDTFIPSNEMAALTVPSALPFTDTMDTPGNWVPGTTGAPNTWAIATTNPHGGSGSMATVASGQYANSSDTWMETAVDLGTAQWPVLTFWDRFGLGEGDWMRLEVYDGVQTWFWMSTCGAYGPMQRSEWRQQQVDLSPFKGRSNIRLRFRVGTDGGAPGEGWFIDDVSLAENPLRDTPQTVPLQEDFESGLANWISAGWMTSDAIAAKDGTRYAWSSDDLRIAPDSDRTLTLARPVVLPADSNVQVTFSVNGIINPGAYCRLQYSQDNGLNWPDLSTANLDAGFNTGADWSRLQASLAGLAGKTVRLRLVCHSDNGARAEDVRVDKLTIAEMPAAVILTSAIPALRSVALTWTPSSLGAAFQRYELWRSTSANVSVFNGMKLAEFSSLGASSYEDTGLLIGQSYFYRVFTVDARDTFIPSNELTATTIPAILPLNDAMETTGNWMPGGANNTWTIATGNVHGGSGCLALTGSGQYNNSSDTWMETSVDLRGTVWPVLTFWDRYALGDGDWLRVEIYDGNQTWVGASRYGVYGPTTRTEWRQQKLDLSEFKDRGNIRIRFRAGTDGGTPSDGWFIDDLSVAENPLAATPLVMPFFETAETTPLTAWQAAHWSRVPDSLAPGGSYALLDTENARVAPDTANVLTLAHPVTLPAGTNASVSYWMKGTLPGGSAFRLQYSENGGLSWPELPAANRDGGYSSAAWELVQVPLSSLGGKTVRLRFASSSDNGARASDIYLDSIGIGDPQPAAPVLLSPVNAAWVSDVRPLLTVQNALDVQSDPLTYRFEVYSDEALTAIVAQNPAIAGGSGTTAWRVDVNLPNNTRYWWRARASDGTASGEWSAASDFYVNEVNHAPAIIIQAGPPSGTVFADLTERFVWAATTDPDAGDFITAYHIQVSADAAFTAPVISVNDIVPPASGARGNAEPLLSVSLESLAGSASLVPGTLYHWRIRAADNRGAWSAWQATPRTFQYQAAPPGEFEEWGSEYFTPAEQNNPAISGPNADPDGDGVGNLLEFAFNTVPTAGASSSRPAVSIAGDRLRISYRQYKDGSGTTGIDYTARDLNYRVECSDSLTPDSWMSGAGVVEQAGPAVDNGDGTETVTVQAVVPPAAQKTQFLRVKVIVQP